MSPSAVGMKICEEYPMPDVTHNSNPSAAQEAWRRVSPDLSFIQSWRAAKRGRGRKKLTRYEYDRYIKSDAWKDMKNRYWSTKIDKCCVSCGAREVPFDFHHITYDRLGCEETRDLVLLCRQCHIYVHELVSIGQASLDRAHKVLLRLNGLKNQRGHFVPFIVLTKAHDTS